MVECDNATISPNEVEPGDSENLRRERELREMRLERQKTLFYGAWAALGGGYVLLPLCLSGIGVLTGVLQREWYGNLIFIVSQLSLYLILLPFLWQSAPCGWNWREKLHWRGCSRRLVGICLAVSVAVTVSCGIITVVWKIFLNLLGIEPGVPPTTELFQNGSSVQFVMLAAFALLSAPWVEEVIFRRALYDFVAERKQQWRMAPLASALLSAVLFAACHGSLLQFPGLIFMALVWQFAAIRTDNLAASVLLHFFNNGFAFFMTLVAIFLEIPL